MINNIKRGIHDLNHLDKPVTTVPNVVADHDGVAKSFDEGPFEESVYQQLPGANPNSIDQD